MSTAESKRRRFTLLDCMVLVAAAAIGTRWVHAYRQSMSDYARAGVGVSFPITIRLFGLLAPFLVTSTLAVFCLRLLRPRPNYRRLVRSPGFVVGTSAILGVAITPLTILMNELGRPPGVVRLSLYLFFMTMRSINYSAPVIAGAWLSLILCGRWSRRRDRDWVDVLAIAHGVCWILLSLIMQINR